LKLFSYTGMIFFVITLHWIVTCRRWPILLSQLIQFLNFRFAASHLLLFHYLHNATAMMSCLFSSSDKLHCISFFAFSQPLPPGAWGQLPSFDINISLSFITDWYFFFIHTTSLLLFFFIDSLLPPHIPAIDRYASHFQLTHTFSHRLSWLLSLLIILLITRPDTSLFSHIASAFLSQYFTNNTHYQFLTLLNTIEDSLYTKLLQGWCLYTDTAGLTNDIHTQMA